MKRREETRKLLAHERLSSSSEDKFSDIESVISKYDSTDLDLPEISSTNVWSRIPARYVLSICAFLGFVNIYALRVNLNVAMVAMVNNSAIFRNSSVSDACEEDIDVNEANSTLSKEGEFAWTEYEQGLILGAFFYGYVVTQIPGGRLAEIVGTKWLFGGGILCTALLTLITPWASRRGIGTLIAVRIAEGLGEGVTFPAMHAMLARWMPKSERGIQSTFVYSGSQIGTVISMPISGLLSDSDFLGGWPSVFYVFGFLGCLWFVFWAILIHQTPSEHPRISRTELKFILDSQGDEQAQMKPPIPWKSILKSVPLWALVIAHFGQNWGFYTLLTELPTYMNNIMHFQIKKNGFLSALPYLLQAAFGWTSAYAADHIRQSGRFRISSIRKFFNTIAFLCPAVCLLGVTLVGCNHNVSVLLFALAMGLNGLNFPGFMVTHVDMAPDFAGTLMGITNCIANFTGFLAPLTVGMLTDNQQTLHQWNIVFYIACVIYVVTAIIFAVFGSAELQPWGLAPKTQPFPKQMSMHRSTLHETDED